MLEPPAGIVIVVGRPGIAGVTLRYTVSPPAGAALPRLIVKVVAVPDATGEGVANESTKLGTGKASMRSPKASATYRIE